VGAGGPVYFTTEPAAARGGCRKYHHDVLRPGRSGQTLVLDDRRLLAKSLSAAVSLVPGYGQAVGTSICNWHNVGLLLQLQ